MPLYEEKLLSPLAIRFGQTRIRSTFRDGHTLEESLSQIVPVAPPEGSNHTFLLRAPFPPIEVVRWRPKMRGADGVALEDESGETIKGKECWFTLDNRRLFCLQRAAAKLLSQGSAACVVRILYDIPTVKSSARKFKTTTCGTCIKVDHHRDQVPVLTWDWASLKYIKALRATGASAALAQVVKEMGTRDLSLLVDAPDMPETPGDVIAVEGRSDVVSEELSLSVAPPDVGEVPFGAGRAKMDSNSEEDASLDDGSGSTATHLKSVDGDQEPFAKLQQKPKLQQQQKQQKQQPQRIQRDERPQAHHVQSQPRNQQQKKTPRQQQQMHFRHMMLQQQQLQIAARQWNAQWDTLETSMANAMLAQQMWYMQQPAMQLQQAMQWEMYYRSMAGYWPESAQEHLGEDDVFEDWMP